jgi:hypothetical protein
MKKNLAKNLENVDGSVAVDWSAVVWSLHTPPPTADTVGDSSPLKFYAIRH